MAGRDHSLVRRQRRAAQLVPRQCAGAKALDQCAGMSRACERKRSVFAGGRLRLDAAGEQFLRRAAVARAAGANVNDDGIRFRRRGLTFPCGNRPVSAHWRLVSEDFMEILKVTGMSCGHCVNAVTKAIRSSDPAAEVRVDLASGTVAVESEQSRPALIRLIEGAGYTVTP